MNSSSWSFTSGQKETLMLWLPPDGGCALRALREQSDRRLQGVPSPGPAATKLGVSGWLESPESPCWARRPSVREHGASCRGPPPFAPVLDGDRSVSSGERLALQWEGQRGHEGRPCPGRGRDFLTFRRPVICRAPALCCRCSCAGSTGACRTTPPAGTTLMAGPGHLWPEAVQTKRGHLCGPRRDCP